MNINKQKRKQKIESIIKQGLEEGIISEELLKEGKEVKRVTNNFFNTIKTIYPRIERYNELDKSRYNYSQQIKKLEEKKQQQQITNDEIVELEKARANYEYIKKEINKKEIGKISFRKFINAIEDYQKNINYILNNQILTLYLEVDEKEKNIETYELIGKLGRAVQKDIASRGQGLTGRFSNSAISDKTVFKKMQSTIKNNDEKDFEQRLKDTYFEVLERGQKSKEKIEKGMLIFWWWPEDSQAQKMLVAGEKGDLNEAYLYFFLNEKRTEKFDFNKNIEHNVDIFMKQGVALVDNISGFLKGDLKVGNINYAIKSQNASIMGYRQIIRFAEAIIEMNEEEAAQYLAKEYIKIINQERKKSGQRNYAIEVIEESILKEGEKMVLDQLKAKLGKV